MSVLVSKRRESKHEALTFSSELHNLLIDLMQRDFGVKDINRVVRLRYAHGLDKKEDFEYYHQLMRQYKEQINFLAVLLTSNLSAADVLYPRTMHEYEKRRDFQNAALVNCVQIRKDLQKIVERFDVDLNVYERHSKAIDREIDLIKRWRQRDNKIKTYIEQNG